MSRLVTPSRLILLVALLLAAVLRLWQLGSFPPGLYHDEAYNGLDALSLTQGKLFPQFYEGWELYPADAHGDNPPQPTRRPIFFEGNYGREPLHIYLMALSISVFGPTPFAVRLVPALAGVLAVFTTYLAARALLPVSSYQLSVISKQLSVSSERSTDHGIRNTAYRSPITDPRPPTPEYAPAFAALTLALLYPAVHFSRFGIRAMLFLPIATLVVYCFWQGINVAEGQRGRGAEGSSPLLLRSSAPPPTYAWFAAAGVLLGLGIYTYAAARLFPLLFVLFVPLWFWRERGALRRFWRPAAVMAGLSLLMALPLLLFFARYPYYFVFRIAFVANKGRGAVEGQPLLTWLLNVGRVFRGLFWLGETHLRHNLPGRPFLDPVQSVLFLTGVMHFVRRRLNLRTLFLLLWFLVMLLPSIMSGDAPHFGRLSGAAAPLAIGVGMGAAWIFSVIRHPLSGFRQFPLLRSDYGKRFTAYGVLFVFFGASGLLTARDYFVRYAAQPALAADFQLADWELGRYAAAQPADTALYFTPTQEEMATIYFALADPQRLQSYAGGQGLIPLGRPSTPALYLVRPSAAGALAQLTGQFPAAQIGPAQNNFVPVHVSADAPRLTTTETADFVWNDKIRLAGWSLAQDEAQLTVTLVWQALAPMDRDYTAFVHLIADPGAPLAQTDRPPAGYPTGDWQPGELVLDRFTVALPPNLEPGAYALQTGFYYLPTLERLGEAAVLTEVVIDE